MGLYCFKNRNYYDAYVSWQGNCYDPSGSNSLYSIFTDKMNIFASDDDPELAARNLDDQRLVKMVLETAQLLSGALYRLGWWNHDLYKPTHLNHPCTVWTAKSRGNFDWLVQHGLALGQEYSYRFRFNIGKHKSVKIILACQAAFDRCPLEPLDRTPFANCTDVYDPTLSVVERYRKYLIETKWFDGKARWTKRDKPDWS